MKHIVLISNSLNSIYNFRYEFVMELLQKYKITLMIPLEETDAPRYKELQEKGCNFIETPFKRRATNPFEELSLCRVYRRLLKQEKPDLVITYTIKPNIYAGMACAKLGIPYFANVTGLGTAFEKKGLLRLISVLLYRNGLRKCNRIFFQNSQNRQIMEEAGICRGNAQMVAGSGINLERFSVSDYPKEDAFLFMARIMRAKGADEFLKAAERIKAEYPEVSFLLLGEYEEDYRERVKSLEAKGVITYYGWQSHPEEYYAMASCLVNPSYHEGMSNVCLEAAASGRPVLASAIPGCRETLTEGVTGLTFSPKNADALYECMVKFHQMSYEEKVKMGRKGREKMEREFDRRKVIAVYQEEIEKVLSDRED